MATKNGNGAVATLETLAGVANDAADQLEYERPYTIRVTIEGVAPLLFHRWSCESVEAKATAAKGSAAKKTDDLESYVYRNDDGVICLPGEYLRGSLCNAAKFRQDPRSPRKSAMDLFKAGVTTLTDLAPVRSALRAGASSDTWDYLDQRRVMVQRNGVTRVRPAFAVGWQVSVDLMVLLPAYINPALLRDVLTDAGRLVGLADYRPTYGRYSCVGWERVI